MNTTYKSRAALAIITSLFFMWGLITVLNDILIPHLKTVFSLSYFEAMLVQLAFFGAYFVGGLLYFIISVKFGDPINKIGYKNGIIIGLIISALGTALFYPAASLEMYGFFLTALFVLGLGFAMLQIAANPYVAILGTEQTASARLNLSQGFNSFGTTIGPIIGGYFIFEYFAKNQQSEAASVIFPYMFLTGLLVLIALLIKSTKLPPFINKDVMKSGAASLQFRQLKLGALAIFVYVGAEVAIGSMLINYFGLERVAGLNKAEASPYVAFYWGGAMIGRFLGSVALSDLKPAKKWLSMVLVAFIAFFVVYFSVFLKNSISIDQIFPFLIFILLNLLAFKLGNYLPGRTLAIFALFPIGLLLTSILSHGDVAMWSVLGIGIFNSIMWSNIFTLAISGLGKHKSQGSSVLVMCIVGGAIIPPIQGAFADFWGVQLSFLVPVVCYIYLAYYGWKGFLPYRVQNSSL